MNEGGLNSGNSLFLLSLFVCLFVCSFVCLLVLCTELGFESVVNYLINLQNISIYFK